MRLLWVQWVAYVVGLRSVSGAAVAPPFDPTQFVTNPQIVITRWAAEPDVVDPVALCFDEAGRAYVAECRDYPYGAGPGGAVNSTIRLLEDTNGDGVPDRSTVFADKLSFVTSVTPWRGGILVAAPPEILFLKDTDNDGKADVREVVLKGFNRGVSDSLVNGLRFHLDGRIHGVNGGNNGVISSPRWRGEDLERGPVDLRGHDFAFAPDTGTVELISRSSGGFGMVFDEFGRAFSTYNINHIQHCYLPRRYAERFPAIPGDAITISISDHEEMSRIFPISESQTRPNHPEQAGHFSAAGGMGYVGSGKWPAGFYGSVFVCDVVGNLVHRDLIRETGLGFVASRATNEFDREFLASRDPAFRPVGLETGPDGALYLLAMQRAVIEHPDYIPEATRSRLDLRAGSDRGRIYRLALNVGMPPAKVDLRRAKNLDLVPLLAHEDQWWRMTAQRLLLERNARDTLVALRALTRDPRPLARVHALWTLRGLGDLNTGELLAALADLHPGVKENALLLAEPVLATTPSLVSPVLLLLSDPSPRVRYQAILTCGAGAGQKSLGPLEILLRVQGGDPRLRQAVLASIAPSDLGTVLHAFLRDRGAAMTQGGALIDVYRDIADLIGARADVRPQDFEAVIRQLGLGVGETVRMTILNGLLAGLERSDVKPKLSAVGSTALVGLTVRAPGPRMPLIWRLCRLANLPDPPALLAALPDARAAVTNREMPGVTRLVQLALLAFDSEPASRTLLLDCLSGVDAPDVQVVAFEILSRNASPGLGAELIGRWRTLAPDLRTRVLRLVLSRRSWHQDLVAALERGTVTLGELNLDLEQRRRLLNDGPPELRSRVQKFIGDGEYANRAAIVDAWLAKLPARGTPAKAGNCSCLIAPNVIGLPAPATTWVPTSMAWHIGVRRICWLISWIPTWPSIRVSSRMWRRPSPAERKPDSCCPRIRLR